MIVAAGRHVWKLKDVLFKACRLLIGQMRPMQHLALHIHDSLRRSTRTLLAPLLRNLIPPAGRDVVGGISWNGILRRSYTILKNHTACQINSSRATLLILGWPHLQIAGVRLACICFCALKESRSYSGDPLLQKSSS